MDWLFRSSDGPPKPTEALGTATEKGKRSCQQPSNATPMQPNIGSSCSKLMSQSAAPPRSWPFLKVGQFWQTKLSGWRTSRKTKASKAASVGGAFHIRPSLRCRLLADIVAKVFFGGSTKILKTADAFRVWRHEGPHRFIPKRPPTFVLAPESLAAAGASKNRL